MDGENFFVSVINADGAPGPLYGPYNYPQAEDVLRAVVLKREPDITDADMNLIMGDGTYTDDIQGGGVYIIQSEEFSADDEAEVN